MSISKTISTVGVGAAVIVGSMLAVNAVSAQHNGYGSDERVNSIAEKLGVESSDVKAAFEADHEERQAEHQAEQTKRIAGLVEDGTLTQEQADALEAKRAEMKEAREAIKEQDLTREQMREQMEASRGEFEAWAEEQGIDLESIRPEGGPGGMMGHGQHGRSNR